MDQINKPSCGTEKLDSNVMVMQASQYRARTDVAVPLDQSMHGRVDRYFRPLMRRQSERTNWGGLTHSDADIDRRLDLIAGVLAAGFCVSRLPDCGPVMAPESRSLRATAYGIGTLAAFWMFERMAQSCA